MNKDKIIKKIADRLEIPYIWLDNLIRFESGYNPQKKNPYSSARGLIQVIDSTAKSVFNVESSQKLVSMFPDFESQMENVVYPYLRIYHPFPTKQSLYMAVFYPKYRFVPDNTEFPDYVQKVNPGIKKVKDYMNFVEGVNDWKNAKTGNAFIFIALLSAVGYYIYKKVS